MNLDTKGILAIAGVVVVGTIIGHALGFDDNSVSYGYIMGIIGSLAYSTARGM